MKKRIVAIVLLVVLLVPFAAVAGQAPSAQQQDRQTTDAGRVTGNQDVRGRTAYGGFFFWYQYFEILRWYARWGMTL